MLKCFLLNPKQGVMPCAVRYPSISLDCFFPIERQLFHHQTSYSISTYKLSILRMLEIHLLYEILLTAL